MKRLIVGITGASGSCYAVRLIDVLRDLGMEVHAVLTASGRQVLDYECGVTEEDLARRVTVLYPNEDVGAALASGSFRTDAMVVLPCSMKTAGAIAHGVTDDLLTRAADVTPGFYHRPETLDDLVNMMVGKILDRLGIEAELFTRWR